jgi:hypothetical protein
MGANQGLDELASFSSSRVGRRPMSSPDTLALGFYVGNQVLFATAQHRDA